MRWKMKILKITAPINMAVLLSMLFVAALFVLSPGLAGDACALEQDLGRLGQYKSVVTLDIFDPERGKKDDVDVEPESVDADEEELRKRFSVYGVIINRSGKHAFLKDLQDKEKKKNRGRMNMYMDIKPGDKLAGWNVKDIDRTGITLAGDGRTVFLPVFSAEKKERRATRPVAMQTPKPKVFTPPAPARPASGNVRTSPARFPVRSGHGKGSSGVPTHVKNRTAATARKAGEVKSALLNAQRSRSRSGTSNPFSGIGGPKIVPPPEGVKPAENVHQDSANNPFLQLLRNGGR
jgi:hypothetical protein